MSSPDERRQQQQQSQAQPAPATNDRPASKEPTVDLCGRYRQIGIPAVKAALRFQSRKNDR